jgi:succinoglycan biosynthesis transport protein ExoP
MRCPRNPAPRGLLPAASVRSRIVVGTTVDRESLPMNVYEPRPLSLVHPEREALSPAQVLLGLARTAKRHKVALLVSVICFIALGIGYVVITPKEFLSTTEMLIDPRKSGEFMVDSASQSTIVPQVDTAVVESEGEVLKSESIARTVIKKLDLVNSPTFTTPAGVFAIIGWLQSHLLPDDEPSTQSKIERETVREFGDRLTVKRVGVSYLFEISFLSPDRDEAANVANAIAEAYVSDDLAAKSATVTRAADWMQDRLKQLGEQATSAEQAVADYKRENNIVNTGGRLLDEQQTAELSSQLSLARAATSDTKAKLDRIEQAAHGGIPDLSIADALNNEVIVKLRDTYADMAKREADLESRLGRDHQAPTRLRADMQTVKSSILEELNRIGESYRSDYNIALARQRGLEQQLNQAIQLNQVGDAAGVRLQQLTSAATSYRALYDIFLQKFAESAQQQSFPITETRVVTVATPPLKKSKPKTIFILLGCGFAGGLVGLGIGWMRDSVDDTLRSGPQAEAVIEARHIASVPRLAPRRAADARNLLRETVIHPTSVFSEAIRQMRVNLDAHGAEKHLEVIGFTSALHGEGKSTIASNLAHLLARSGVRVILVDCDIRQSTVSGLSPKSTRGLLELLAGSTALDDVITNDPGSGLSVLPTVGGRDCTNSGDLLASPQMKAVLQTLRERYQLVIVDLPPLLPVIDTKVAAGLVDGFVFVAHWGQTPVEAITDALQASARVRTRIVGVVLNKADPHMVERQMGGNYAKRTKRLA